MGREEELERELRAHLELEAEEQRENGLAPREAWYAARRLFGNTTYVKEEVRGAWGWTAWESVCRELGFGARNLRKSPGFCSAAVLTLALGIGANSAMFSIVNGVLLHALPFARAGDLVAIYARDAQGHRQYVSQPDLDDWRAASHSFRSIASWVPQSVNLTGFEAPARLIGNFVSSNFLSLLGIAPALGRDFAAGEDRPGGPRVAIISDRLWRSRFGSDSGILGKTAEFNGEPYAIIGVLPASFVFPSVDADVYLPAFKYPNYSLNREQTSCAVIGRLREGVSLRSAQSEVAAIAGRLAAAYPASNQGRGATVVSLQEDISSDLRPSVVALTGAVLFVLLIACANVAGLLITRMLGRERERAVRIALGASRAMLVLHVVSESAWLAAGGAAAGLLLANWGLPAVRPALAPYLPRGTTIALDGGVVLFTIGVSLLMTVALAAIPIWQKGPAGILRRPRGAGSAAASNLARGMLAGAQIALAFVLLGGAGLMIKSLGELGRANAGFDTHNLLTLAYRVPRNKYPTGAAQSQFHREVVTKIKAVPGVLSAASVRAAPLGGNGAVAEFEVTGRTENGPTERPQAQLNFADPDFFSTLRIPVLAGRVFSEHDLPDGVYVIVINRELARRYFGGGDPIGQKLVIPSLHRTGEIVGVVGDVKQYTAADAPEPQIYGALAQNPFLFTSLAVRTAGDPLRMAKPIRRAIWQVDKDQPVWAVESFDHILKAQSRFRQLVTAVLAAFAGVAFLLASVGIFGVVSYTVSQRTPEVGVRRALGAQGRDVLLLVLRQSALVTAGGVTAGGGAAIWLSQYLRTQLYGVSALDPGVYAGVAAALVAVSAAACLIPARRAMRIDPTEALRYE